MSRERTNRPEIIIEQIGNALHVTGVPHNPGHQTKVLLATSRKVQIAKQRLSKHLVPHPSTTTYVAKYVTKKHVSGHTDTVIIIPHGTPEIVLPHPRSKTQDIHIIHLFQFLGNPRCPIWANPVIGIHPSDPFATRTFKPRIASFARSPIHIMPHQTAGDGHVRGKAGKYIRRRICTGIVNTHYLPVFCLTDTAYDRIKTPFQPSFTIVNRHNNGKSDHIVHFFFNTHCTLPHEVSQKVTSGTPTTSSTARLQPDQRSEKSCPQTTRGLTCASTRVRSYLTAS